MMNNYQMMCAGMDDLISRQAAIDALDEVRHALWEIDIPSPTVPEYVEHHEQVQSVWKLLDKKQKELYVLPSAQPEIIRCKNCKWCEDADGLMCKNPTSWVVATDCDFGCVLAERRTDG